MCGREMRDIPSARLSMRMFIHACADFPLIPPPSPATTLSLYSSGKWLSPKRSTLTWTGSSTRNKCPQWRERECVCVHDGSLCVWEDGGGVQQRKQRAAFFWAYWISRWLWLEPVAWESVCFLPVVVNVIECSCQAFLHWALCLGKVQCYCMFSQDMLT